MRPLVLAALLLPLATSAQITPTLLYELESQNTDFTYEFGTTLATLGDLDGDGAADLAVADPLEDAGGGLQIGRVYLYSGADGTFLRSRSGPAEGQEPDGEYFGSALAGLGDVTGDGVPDLAVGAPGYYTGSGTTYRGHAFIVSGADGARIRRFTSPTTDKIGESVGALGDVDGDGVGDVAIGQAGEGNRLLHLYSGATGVLLRTLPDVVASPVSVSDLTGDGVPEVAAAADGRYRVYDPTTGVALQTVTDPDQPALTGFGGALASVGDLDGDGVSEIAAGARSANPTGPETRAGVAYVFSGATGALVRTFSAPAGSTRLGECVAGPGDVDRDGTPDVLVCAEARAFVFSGATGDVLAVIEGRMMDRSRAVAVLRAGTAEAGAVVALGVSSTGGSRPDRARVYGFPGPVSSEPSPSAGVVSLAVSPNPSAGASSVAVSLSSPASVRVVVVDALGRAVAVLHEGPLSVGETRLSVPASLPAGVYAVVAEGAGGAAVARLVVAR